MKYEIKEIGVLRTPYVNNAPYQSVNDDEGDFRIVVNKEYEEGLFELEKFNYIYVVYYLHRTAEPSSMLVSPHINDLDVKHDANYGWVESLEDKEHLILHIKGIPH